MKIPLTDLGEYLAENGLEITGQVGAQRALTFELAPVGSTLPETIPPAWFGLPAAERDRRLAGLGYRVTRERTLRDGSILFELGRTL